MEVLHPRCAGLDVHIETVVACVRIASGGEVSRAVRTFETTTARLIELAEWLEANGCTHAAMEATGVYWKPVWQVLAAGGFELVLANAAHVKNVPGRKTDVNDATWLAELLAHGLIRASFVPGPEIQELRGLLRTRKQLVREKASHVQRLQKTLEEANIKLESVLSDVMGRSGRAMIQALIAGETDPAKLAALAHPKVRAPQARLREALRGRVKRHHRFLLDLHLQQIDALDAGIAAIDREVDAGLASFRDARQAAEHHPWGQPTQRPGHPVGDRHRHEPVCHGCASALLGRPVPAQRRKRRQAPLDPPAHGGPLAEGHARSMRLGRCAH
jgi:transposase